MIVAGALAVAAPFLTWFRVTCSCTGSIESVSLAGTSYGTFMTFLGLVTATVGVIQLRRWESWRGWATIGAAAMVFVVAAGLRGALDPIGGAKESLRESSSIVADLDIATGRGFRERVYAAVDRGAVDVQARSGGWFAAGAGAIGLAAGAPVLLRRRPRVGPPG